MLYNLLFPLSDHWSILNLFKYITFRSIGATLTALLLSFLIGPWLIRSLQRLQSIGQPIRSDGPQRHILEKTGTPTMGGTLILLAMVVPTLLWANLTNPFIWMVLTTTLTFGAIGFWDDYRKVARKNSKGISARTRFLLQSAIALSVAYWLRSIDHGNTFGSLAIPFFKNLSVDLGWLYYPFTILVIVGTSNAVNLTDGLDGLAIGPTMLTAATFLVIAYVTGHLVFAGYLGIPYVSGAGELAIFCGAMVGAALGFLWFNTYPAQVFMGDVGSLALGAALGTIGLVTRHEIVLAIVGGIFVVETLSVIVQVASFKLIGKRVFRMAPIHHHFELKGWAEPKIIVRFWIISIILALIGISTLKIR
ncbi:MAG: phospho-N-acetylmuramoyl-pentapeptide-transferase [Magnetococcales bacterium]|nr:phospho-N-acetylmuramoyl-pentapeptide-transferase [Magnetococcales bacterium]MBF0113612.1 phospho-N-acetylmuramoyl-pentapeptide-transferase [Magnetococcales bacterium]